MRKEAEILERIALTQTFPEDRFGQRQVANAFSDAADFLDIGRALPRRKTQQILAELREAMKGSVDESHSNAASYRFQSQYWLASVLHRGGYSPTVPEAPGTKSPDFLVEEGIHRYGVEIKRPASARSAASALAKGAKQLAEFGVHGGIIIDVTDCVATEAMNWIKNPEDARDTLLGAEARLVESLRGTVIDDKRGTLREGFSNVLMLFVIARGWSWIGDPNPSLALFASAGGSVFVRPVKNLRYYQTINLMDRITAGLRSAGYQFQRFADIAGSKWQ